MSFEKYLQSELLLQCLKNCLNRKEISSEVKEKIALLLYEDSDYFDSDKGVKNNRNESCVELKYNPLGVDDDLLNKSTEPLSKEQEEHLRLLILDEIRKYHSFYSSVRSEIKSLPSIESTDEQIETIQTNLYKQAEKLEEGLKFKNKMERLKVEASQLVTDMGKNTLTKSNKLIQIERKLFEEIAQQITDGNRGEALEKVERMLLEKIAKNNNTIQQLNYELSECME